MRSDYRAQLTDREGSRVMVQVDARAGQPEAVELNLFTQDADKRTRMSSDSDQWKFNAVLRRPD